MAGHRRLLPIVLFLLPALLVSAALVACGEGGSSAAASLPAATGPATMASASNPFGVYSPGNLDEVPMRSRQTMIDTLGVGSYEEFQDYNIAMMREAGTSWTRVDFWYTDTGFHETPDYMERLRVAGFEVVAGIRPLNDYAPEDLSRFKTDLRGLLGRYPWIRIWQIGNEPNISLSNPDEYPRIFFEARAVIREVCPDCRIMLAGVALRFPSEKGAQEIYRRLLTAIAAESGPEPPFDIFDLHFYGLADQEWLLLTNLDEYQRIMRESGLDDTAVEFWLSENAIHTGKPYEPPDSPENTEEDQAAELLRRFVSGLGAGLDRVSWARPYENYRYSNGQEDGYYDLTALVYNGLGREAAEGVAAGTKKQSWHAYQTLIRKTEGYSELRVFAPGAYQFSFADGRPPVYVVWDPGTGENASKLLGKAEGSVKATDLWGNEWVVLIESLPASRVPFFVEAV